MVHEHCGRYHLYNPITMMVRQQMIKRTSTLLALKNWALMEIMKELIDIDVTIVKETRYEEKTISYSWRSYSCDGM